MVFEVRYLLCQYQFKNSSKRDILIVTLSREGAEIANVMVYLLILMKGFFGNQQKYFIKLGKIMIIPTKLLLPWQIFFLQVMRPIQTSPNLIYFHLHTTEAVLKVIIFANTWRSNV